jgi:predicted transcriptional regulator
MTDNMQTNIIELATEITIAWLGNPNVRVSVEDVPAFLHAMHATLTDLDKGPGEANDPALAAPEEENVVPAVSVRKSLASPDHIISMIDGKPYRTLRRHLSRHGLTPEQYRERYNLKSDYPMVAPSYSLVRSAMAQKIGLGRKRMPADAPAKRQPRGRKSATESE